jgi:hypothetical protein
LLGAVETNLPYTETATPYTDNTCEKGFMDEDKFLLEVLTDSEVSRVCVHWHLIFVD